ncbi:XRE family transcriptional regulator [Pseudokineococcus basanitobsidens]|uniref:XRE family transcriptional regulator n=1 Tax=Pseudokineococcus basanitobsidens TaxID=1926649 RepID=A0ABU8RPC3_9ACTN
MGRFIRDDGSRAAPTKRTSLRVLIERTTLAAEAVRPRGQRLTVLRHLYGLTQQDLASRVDLSPSFISHVERGTKLLPVEVVERLALAFALPTSFFYVPTPAWVGAQATFRKSSKATRRDEERVSACYDEASRLFHWASEASGYHESDLPDLDVSTDDPEAVGAEIRRRAGLGKEDPVLNVTRLLERLGIGVVHHLDHLAMDGSAHAGVSRPSSLNSRPLIGVATPALPPPVKRLTLMHELGHLIFDRDLAVPITSVRAIEERRAFRLAGAVLLPTRVIQQRVSEGLKLHAYLGIKADYGVSVGGILKRARDVDVISRARYRSLSIQLSSQGWRYDEPVEVADEKPILFRQALSRASQGARVEDVGKRLGVAADAVARWAALEEYSLADVPTKGPSVAKVFDLEAARQRVRSRA